MLKTEDMQRVQTAHHSPERVEAKIAIQELFFCFLVSCIAQIVVEGFGNILLSYMTLRIASERNSKETKDPILGKKAPPILVL